MQRGQYRYLQSSNEYFVSPVIAGLRKVSIRPSNNEQPEPVLTDSTSSSEQLQTDTSDTMPLEPISEVDASDERHNDECSAQTEPVLTDSTPSSDTMSLEPITEVDEPISEVDASDERHNDECSAPTGPVAGELTDIVQTNMSRGEQLITKQRKQVKEYLAAHNISSSDDEVTFEEAKMENDELKNERLCKICKDNDANRVFLPCGHLVLCGLCSPSVKSCILCRAQIRGVISVYYG